tara:strand:+ start:1104 stop:1262 length:159 start_codon:yes stop_codon:yes gene_type:complete
MGFNQSKIKQQPLHENLLTNELLADILKRLEFIEDKIWVIDNKINKLVKKTT